MKPACLNIFLLLLSLQSVDTLAQVTELQVGLSSNRTLIQAMEVAAASPSAPRVLLISGFSGLSEASTQVQRAVEQYSFLDVASRPVNLLVIPLANPESETLMFPPQGNAYAENPLSHALWRWIGTHSPDLIIIPEANDWGLSAAVQSQPVAGYGEIPVRRVSDIGVFGVDFAELSTLDMSSARQDEQQRLARSPNQLAMALAQIYGRDFSTPAYVPGMSLLGRLRLGRVAAVEEQIENYLTGGEIEITNASLMAGQLVFAEHAALTGDPASLNLVLQAANLGFDDQGTMLDAMPFHNEMSDSVFMAPPLLARAGVLGDDLRYFDMAARHIDFMSDMLLRDDGLFRHSPLADVAWSRGNAFPALGLALVLSDFPDEHPAYPALLGAYQRLLETLLGYQDTEGMWHQVIDHPGSFAELTSTAMISIAIKRGIDNSWLDATLYQPALDAAWQAVLRRTSPDGEFIDVCASTGKMPSLDAYLDRPALLGRDDRAGGMVMNLAIELMN